MSGILLKHRSDCWAIPGVSWLRKLGCSTVIRISNKFWEVLMLLVWRIHSENHGQQGSVWSVTALNSLLPAFFCTQATLTFLAFKPAPTPGSLYIPFPPPGAFPPRYPHGHSLLEVSDQIILIRSSCVCMCSHFTCVRSFSTLDCSLPGSVCHGILQASILECGLPSPPPRDLPNPGIQSVSSLLHWQEGSLPLAPPGKPSKILTEHVKAPNLPHLTLHCFIFLHRTYHHLFFI